MEKGAERKIRDLAFPRYVGESYFSLAQYRAEAVDTAAAAHNFTVQ
jgi:hypothetical protein